MTRDHALALLRSKEADARTAGVRAMYVFGSTARGEADASSDVDLFVDDDERLDLFALADLRRRLSDLLGRPVDLGTRNGLRPDVRPQIEREAVRVF